MRKRARTDLRGGRSAMVVPTATLADYFLFADDPLSISFFCLSECRFWAATELSGDQEVPVAI
jgi:hypothetical protein